MEQPKCGYTDMWAVKMSKVFNALDRQKRGYITEKLLTDVTEQFYKDYPKVQKEGIKKSQHITWVELYNNGRNVPEDYQLTEEVFIKNLWVSVNQPDFKEKAAKTFRDSFALMDLKKDGYMSKDEYMKINSWRAGEEQALAAFTLMDTDSDGYVSFDELMDAKVFYYTDLHNKSHPFNLMNGPLDVTHTSYTDMWAVKMRKVFNALDRQKRGYITVKLLTDIAEQFYKDYPKVQKEGIKKSQRITWVELYNNGRNVPEDYQLTEEMFIKNLWVSVNQPDFKEKAAKTFRDSFALMDLKKDGYMSKDEYMKINSWRAGEEQALAAFTLMDTDSDGYVSFDELMDAKVFYYTDLQNKSHPFNLMNGPLDVTHTSYTDMWAVKMRKVFNALDRQKRGYITVKLLTDIAEQFYKDYPKVQKEGIKKSQRITWVELYNNGRNVPEDYQLTEEMFIKNLWVSVNQPDFKEKAAETFRDNFLLMDLKKDGYMSKDEYMKMNSWRAGEEQALAAFTLMDTDSDGYVSFDELIDAKVFYYTDLCNKSHPFNLMNGPLDVTHTSYTDMWAVKMRKVFNALDRQKRGYITVKLLTDVVEQCYKDYPKVQKEGIKKTLHITWVELYNNGRNVPEDYQLTEEMFIKNLWVSVNQPDFKEKAAETFRDNFPLMDLKKDGYMSKDEYMKMNSWRAGEEQALAAFTLMDTDSDGYVSFDELIDAKLFYYTDLYNKSHPFNLMNGPLDTPVTFTVQCK